MKRTSLQFHSYTKSSLKQSEIVYTVQLKIAKKQIVKYDMCLVIIESVSSFIACMCAKLPLEFMQYYMEDYFMI